MCSSLYATSPSLRLSFSSLSSRLVSRAVRWRREAALLAREEARVEAVERGVAPPAEPCARQRFELS